MPSSRQSPAPENFKNHKLRGEWVEMRFMTLAAQHGFTVSRPWGDSAPYDMMLERDGRVLRVQVKCTTYPCGNSYRCHVTASGVPYAKEQVDFIAAYIIPLDVWYIIPAGAPGRHMQILLSPHRKNTRYYEYKEAWHLLL